MGYRCLFSCSYFHNLFEEFCSIFIKPNVPIIYVPGYYDPVTVYEVLMWEAGLVASPQPRRTQYRLCCFGFAPKPQDTDGGEQKVCMAHQNSAALPAISQPSWVLSLIPTPPYPSKHCYHSVTDGTMPENPEYWSSKLQLPGEQLGVTGASAALLPLPSSSNVTALQPI